MANGSPPAPAQIPTLSAAGLFAMGLLLAAMAIAVFVRRR
jgi:hypothetical protein